MRRPEHVSSRSRPAARSAGTDDRADRREDGSGVRSTPSLIWFIAFDDCQLDALAFRRNSVRSPKTAKVPNIGSSGELGAACENSPPLPRSTRQQYAVLCRAEPGARPVERAAGLT